MGPHVRPWRRDRLAVVSDEREETPRGFAHRHGGAQGSERANGGEVKARDGGVGWSILGLLHRRDGRRELGVILCGDFCATVPVSDRFSLPPGRWELVPLS